jgi:predicted dithiol-disulfide oxidoreductase (DUF899 family)
MAEHAIGTREEWQAARKELLQRENEYAELGREVTEQRQRLPWVPVDKEYVLQTEEGPKTLVELFDGRSQLLIYHLMYGPDYSRGACPGCTNLADHFDGGLVHVNHRDTTFSAVSRAPIEDIAAYKRRMGWRFPWASSYESDFAADFGFYLTAEQLEESDEARAMLENPPDWLQEWADMIGGPLAVGMREGPGWNVFALEDGTVYHTYADMPPRGGPYYNELLDLTPNGRGDSYRTVRKDEYADA